MTCKPIFNLIDRKVNLESNPSFWGNLFSNANAIPFIEYLLIHNRVNDGFKYNEKEYHLNIYYSYSWFSYLLSNTGAIHLIKGLIKLLHIENLVDMQYCYNLSSNENAIEILENNPDCINWFSLSRNCNAIGLLRKNIDKINWSVLSTNRNAIELLKEYFDEIDWYNLSINVNAIDMLMKHSELINWDEIACNPNALDIIKENIHKISPKNLSRNTNKDVLKLFDLFEDKYKDVVLFNFIINPATVPMLNILFADVSIENGFEPFIQKCIEYNMIDIYNYSNELQIVELIVNIAYNSSPDAINIIEKVLQIIDNVYHNYCISYARFFTLLAQNPNATHLIYKLDYDKMFKNNREFKCELTKKVFEPSRIQRICEIYNVELVDYVELI
jgi:hypothetical protein